MFFRAEVAFDLGFVDLKKKIFVMSRRSRETRFIKAYKLDPVKLGCFEK
jgi:hypothetical protein